MCATFTPEPYVICPSGELGSQHHPHFHIAPSPPVQHQTWFQRCSMGARSLAVTLTILMAMERNDADELLITTVITA